MAFFMSRHRKKRKAMPVFRVEKNKGYTVMSNYHLRDQSLSLKAKGLLSQILSLPEYWDYTLSGLCYINWESKDAIRSALNELERAEYIERHQTTDEGGKFSSNKYIIHEQPVSLPPERNGTEAATQSAVGIYREIIKENIEYDHLLRYSKIAPEELDSIVELLVETVCMARETIRVVGDDSPAELVKAKLLKLNSSHIEFVMDCMQENTTRIRNIQEISAGGTVQCP